VGNSTRQKVLGSENLGPNLWREHRSFSIIHLESNCKDSRKKGGDGGACLLARDQREKESLKTEEEEKEDENGPEPTEN